MQTFSKRNNLSKEYSGYEQASEGLRNRLLQLYGHPYSGDEHNFGLGNENWIHERAFDKDLQMHFGKKIPIESFRHEEETSYDQVFDYIELYYQRAKQDLETTDKKLRLLRDISLAFSNSGSVYEFDAEEGVILKINDTEAKRITTTDSILEPFEEAQKLYRECVDGLITRTKAPKDIVGNMNIVFEEFTKKTTGELTHETIMNFLRNKLNFHPTQMQIIEKLRAYRGDVWGAAHAGNTPKPNEGDALWFLESVISQINYIDNKVKALVS